ncbi:MAG: AEC family transporter [Anaerolineales bacterium]|nr:AEC family transporter [Anaerolineales bacterium]
MTTLLHLFAENLVPVLVVAAVGYILQRGLRLDPAPLSRVAFYAALPALQFQLLLTTEIPARDIGRMMLLAAAIIGCMGAVSFLISRALRLPERLAAAFILSVTFMNAGNYGLSVNGLAFGQAGLAWASMFYLTSSMLANAAGVYIASVGKTSPAKSALGLLKVPTLYAIPLALLVRGSGAELPAFASRPIELLAVSAVPIMLLLLGMQIAKAGLPQQRRLVSLSAGLRLIAGPAIAWALVPVFGLPTLAGQVAVLEAGMPTAVLNTIIATEFDSEPGFVAGAVLVSTLLSPLTLTPLLALLGA